MAEFTIEDLRLPCEHGENGHCYEPASDPPYRDCSGGRVPTQTEINALAKPDYKMAALVALGDEAIDGGLVITYSQMIVLIDAALGGGT